MYEYADVSMKKGLYCSNTRSSKSEGLSILVTCFLAANALSIWDTFFYCSS